MLTRPRASAERGNRRWLALLLLIPFIALLWPPFYNITAPDFLGIPFFYWYQLLWIFITAILTAVLFALGV